jgi:hypothetical protein
MPVDFEDGIPGLKSLPSGPHDDLLRPNDFDSRLRVRAAN